MREGFLKATAITFTTRIINLLIGVVVSIMLARLLGAEGRGIYALAVLIPSLAIIFTNLGIVPASIYHLSKKKYSPQLVAGNNIILSILLSLAGIILITIFLLFFKDAFFTGVPVYAIILVILSIPFRQLTSNLNNLFLALRRYFTYNLLNLIGVSVQVIVFIFLFLASSYNLLTVIITYLLASVIVFITVLSILKRTIKFFELKLNRDYLKDTFSYGTKAYLGRFVSFLHLRIDQLIINYFLNPMAVGLYAVAVGLTERLWLLAESTGTILFPRISSETNEEAQRTFTPIVCRNILFLTVIAALILFALGRWIILLFYSSEFLNSLPAFQILLIGTIAVAGSKILANDIAGRGKPIINTYVNIVSLVVNITLNIIFIPHYGIAGAAWATSISYSLILLIRVIIYSKISQNRIRDIVLIKSSDFQLYKNLLCSIINKRRGER